MAQVGARLRLGRVGPEQERQVLTRLGDAAMEQEVGEERLGAARVERGERHPLDMHAELTEQPDAQRRSWHGDRTHRHQARACLA